MQILSMLEFDSVKERCCISKVFFFFMWGRENEKQNTSFNSDGTE